MRNMVAKHSPAVYPTTLAEARGLFALALEKIGPPVVTDDNEADLAPTVKVSAAELRAALDEAFAEMDAMFIRHADEDGEAHHDTCMCLDCMDSPGRQASDEYRRACKEAYL